MHGLIDPFAVILGLTCILMSFLVILLAEDEQLVINVQLDIPRRMHPHIRFSLSLLFGSGTHSFLNLLAAGTGIWVMFSVDAYREHVIELDATFKNVLEHH